MKLVECVPNFSEGKDRAIIDQITAEITKVAGVKLLDVDPGAATNRTVVTFAGAPEEALEAAFNAIRIASELIDMSRQKGAHPRMGATDVCPFVPITGVTREECIELSRRLAKRVGEELKIPVYMYEFAATRPERKSLSDIRTGEYEALPEKLKKPDWKPDFGPATFNARAGATVIGVRPFLIAYNINLNTTSVKLAKDIAFALREKGRLKRDAKGEKIIGANGEPERIPGLFKECKATGWYIPEYSRAQITINLTDYHTTSMHDVFDAACKKADELGIRVTGSEIVGLVPKEALISTGLHYLKKQGVSTGVPESDLIRTAIQSLGLADVSPFDPKQKIIESHFEVPMPLANMTINGFTNELSTNSPAPGGGSVAALAGAQSAALTSMVAALTHSKKGYEQHNAMMDEIGAATQKLKDFFLKAIDDDTNAFNKVMDAFSLPKGTDDEKAVRKQAIEDATKGATTIPLTVLENCVPSLEYALKVAKNGNKNSLSDAGVAGLTGRAAAHGAYYNVLINLGGLKDETWKNNVRAKADECIAKADKISDEIKNFVEGSLK